MKNKLSKGNFLEKNFNNIIAVVVFIAVFIAGISLYFYFTNIDEPIFIIKQSWGDFGSYIGGVLNPTYSFLALIILLSTLFLQNKTLQESMKSFREQKELTVQQLFENSFYNLLKLYGDIVDGLEEKVSIRNQLGEEEKITYKGRDCFRYYYEKKIKKDWVSVKFEVPVMTESKDRFILFNEDYGHKIGHYFRILYRIYMFIEDFKIANKKFYSGIVRAQLSSYELLVLFYNCLSQDGEKFKKYAKEYALFENMPGSFIEEIKDDLMLYGDSKEYEAYFGDNRIINNYNFEFASSDLSELINDSSKK